MNSKEYLEKMTTIQQNLLDYIDSEGSANVEEKFKNLKDLLITNNIQNNQHEFKSFLHLLTKISKYHHRSENFFSKIERILENLKGDLLKYFSNSELFHIFKSNKRILLFLFEEKIMNFDEFICQQILEDSYKEKKYPQYFQPEIQPFIKNNWLLEYNEGLLSEIQNDIPDDFYEKRKIGENDSHICRLIRNDLLDDFIIYINERNYPIDSTINLSNYETNNFLLKKRNVSLIEYAAFFGSIKIFQYLKTNKVSLSSLWNYSIHSNNAEIFEILDENHVELEDNESYEGILIESIKCHHNNFAYYIQSNYLQDDAENSNIEMINGLKFYNFIFIQKDKINETSIYYLCKYDYYLLAFLLLKANKININEKIIQ